MESILRPPGRMRLQDIPLPADTGPSVLKSPRLSVHICTRPLVLTCEKTSHAHKRKDFSRSGPWQTNHKGQDTASLTYINRLTSYAP